MVTSTDVATIAAIIAGISLIIATASLVLGIVNYLRDRAKIAISLQWDMANSQSLKLYGNVTVANMGRRAIFVSHAVIDIPSTNIKLILMDSIVGIKLGEGDAPVNYWIEQTKDLKKHSDKWGEMRAIIIDSAGKKYFSKPSRKKPSWAE